MAPLTYPKLKTMNGTVEDLPLRPAISNIIAATYELAKYLAQILKPIGQSQYTLKNSKSFMKTVEKQRIPPGYQRVSFHVMSLFYQRTFRTKN